MKACIHKILKRKALIKRLIVCIGVFILSFRATAQRDVNYAIHANIIYHFTKYIDWPVQKKTGDFIIGVVGDTPLLDELKASVANKKVGDQLIVVKRFSVSAVTFNCHILFVSEEESSSFKRILTITRGTSTLLVSEDEDLAQKGSCINFIIINERLRLEINRENIEERDLSIASELLKLGTIVKN